MKLIFIGTGSAFTVGEDNYHSNALLVAPNGKTLLIDCGSDARFSLTEQGYTYKDINDVYVSHLHSDHAGGLEWLGFTHKFDPSCKRPNLYIASTQVEDVWKKVLSGGMSSLQGEMADLSTYYNVKSVAPNGCFKWEGITFRLVQTVHIMNGFEIVPSYGLLFKLCGKVVFFTTDTQFAPAQIMDFYKMSDIVFHDCETSNPKSKVHAHYTELLTLDDDIKRKLWLYHYNHNNPFDATADGFRGFVVKGQMFDFDDESTL